MTTTSEPNDVSTDEPAVKQLDPFRDAVLTDLVALANTTDSDAGLPLTFTVGGSAICGQAISKAEYFRLLGEKTGFSELLKPYRELAESEVGQDIDDEAFEWTLTVHLKEAKMFVGNAQINLGTWRGRLDRIDGWSFGTLGRQEE